MKFEEKLINLRKAKGLSQEELAEQLGVSRQAVSRWELGSTLPDIPNLLQLCELFGVSADYLVKDEISDVEGNGIRERNGASELASEPSLEEEKQKAKALERIAKARTKNQSNARQFYYAGWIMAILCMSFSAASLIKSDKLEVTLCIILCVCALVYFGLYAWTIKKIEKLDLEREELE